MHRRLHAVHDPKALERECAGQASTVALEGSTEAAQF